MTPEPLRSLAQVRRFLEADPRPEIEELLARLPVPKKVQVPMYKGLETLTPQQRRCVEMHLGGMGPVKIAGVLGVMTSTVKFHLRKARARRYEKMPS